MSHTTFEWAVVRCMDGRLNKYISDYLKSQGVPEIHDTIAIPGGPRDLTDEESLTSLAVKNVSISLHGIKKIMLIQHTDCGAYGGRNDCGGNEEADFNIQKGELEKSVHAIEKRHPELEIHAVIAHIHDSGEIAFHKI